MVHTTIMPVPWTVRRSSSTVGLPDICEDFAYRTPDLGQLRARISVRGHQSRSTTTGTWSLRPVATHSS